MAKTFFNTIVFQVVLQIIVKESSNSDISTQRKIVKPRIFFTKNTTRMQRSSQYLVVSHFLVFSREQENRSVTPIKPPQNKNS
jgi:hypothetical protein